MAKKIKAVAWASASVTASTNWFGSNVSVGGSGPVRHVLQCTLASTDSVINVSFTKDSVIKTVGLNGGAVVTANKFFKEAYLVVPGTTYNIQHVTSAQPIWAIVAEDEDDLTI